MKNLTNIQQSNPSQRVSLSSPSFDLASDLSPGIVFDKHGLILSRNVVWMQIYFSEPGLKCFNFNFLLGELQYFISIFNTYSFFANLSWLLVPFHGPLIAIGPVDIFDQTWCGLFR